MEAQLDRRLTLPGQIRSRERRGATGGTKQTDRARTRRTRLPQVSLAPAVLLPEPSASVGGERPPRFAHPAFLGDWRLLVPDFY